MNSPIVPELRMPETGMGFSRLHLLVYHMRREEQERFWASWKAHTMGGSLGLTNTEGATTDDEDGSCNLDFVMGCPKLLL